MVPQILVIPTAVMEEGTRLRNDKKSAEERERVRVCGWVVLSRASGERSSEP